MRFILAVLVIVATVNALPDPFPDPAVWGNTFPEFHGSDNQGLVNEDLDYEIVSDKPAGHSQRDSEDLNHPGDEYVDFVSSGDVSVNNYTHKQDNVAQHYQEEKDDDVNEDDHYSLMSEADEEYVDDEQEEKEADNQDMVDNNSTEHSYCQSISRSFTLLVQPKTVIVEEHSQVQLLCQLLTHNQTTPIPNVTFNWLYQSVECFQDNDNCSQNLQQMSYDNTTDEADLSAVYDLHQVTNNNTGSYTCTAQITECIQESYPQIEGTEVKQSVYLRVYTKPNYTTHIAAISTVAILLLAILIGLVFFVRRIQKVQEQRYQQLLSSTKIQFHPTKVLELPNNAVYHPTTVVFDRRSFSFNSKYSLSSQDEM